MYKKVAALCSAFAFIAMFVCAPLASAAVDAMDMATAMDMDAECHSHAGDAGSPAATGHGMVSSACCGVACHGYALAPVDITPILAIAMILALFYSFFMPPARTVHFFRPPKN